MASIPSLEELKKMRTPVRNVNKENQDQLSGLDRLAMWITSHVGTMGFFILIFIWTAFWLSWNNLAPQSLRFDPAPAFVLWLFISNMIQIFLMPLLMVGQNLQARHSEGRSQADYETDVKAEREMEAMLQHLESLEAAVARLEGKEHA